MSIDLADLFHAHDRAMKAEIHTSLPAKVAAYDPVTNLVVCDPVVKMPFLKADGTREYDTLPTLTVPVQWPRFGGFVVRGPLSPGDHVNVMFSEASLAEWRTTGQLSEPVDVRRMSLGYAFAIPGAEPDVVVMAPTDAVHVAAGQMVVGQDGGKQIRIGGTGVEVSQSGVPAISPVALAVPTDLSLSAAFAGIVALTAAVNALIATFNSHTHAYAPGPGAPVPSSPPASPAASAPAAPASPGTTASTLTKSL